MKSKNNPHLEVNANEAVGSGFSGSSLLSARKKAWQSLNETALQIKPGDREKDAAAVLKSCLAKNGVEKIWHPPQIRFGPNTIKPFGEKSDPNVVLGENDLFFLDIGPVFDGHEGDVGRTYTLGPNKTFARIAQDTEDIFNLTRVKWEASGLSGRGLYDYATRLADDRGWRLGSGGASGHRVSDFPHAVHYRGKLRTQEQPLSTNRWILEIHLLDPGGQFGAFFEDLL